MVFGSDVGVVLRARRGRNLLVQLHGLDAKTVTQAATEVAAVLDGDLPSSIELLDIGVGVQRSLACGHIRVLGNRYAVVYRLLNQVLVVVVSRSHANVFANLNLVAAISRLLVAELRSVEVTPERLLKKYAQVYLSVDALVNRGSLDLIGALMEANSVLDSLSPDGQKARKARQQAELQAVGSQQFRQISRRVPQPVSDHGRFSFAAPKELTSIQINTPVYQLPELPAPDRPLLQPKQQQSAALPLLEEQQQQKQEEEKEKAGEWATFDEEQQQQQPPSALLQFKGPPLHLRETWQVEVVGSKVVQAGLVGAVRWAAPEAKALAGSTPFKLQAPEAADPLVCTALKCCLAAERGTKHGPVLGSFLADTLSPLPAAAPLLQYNLPASYDVLPLMARMTAGLVQHKKNTAVALVSLQWHVPRELEQQAKDLVVDLFVPPGFAAPRRVAPQGAFWSASQSMLRWPLGVVGQGAAGVAVAAFRVKGGAEAAAAGLARCHAVLKLQGEGGTITGVQLAQSRTAAASMQVEPATSNWAAFVLVRPHPGQQ